MGTVPKASWLQRQQETWYAVLDIPKALRPIFGKVRFKQTLKTQSKAEAQQRVLGVIHAWRQQIEEARRTGKLPDAAILPIMEDAMAWRDAAISSDDENPVTVADLAVERAEALEAKFGKKAAKAYFEVATGAATPIEAHLERYLVTRDVAPRYKAEVRTIIQDVKAWGGTTVEEFDRKRVKDYFNHLLDVRGLALKTVRTKYRSALSTYWAWLDNEGLLADHLSPKVWLDVSLPKPSEKTVRASLKRAYTVEDVRRIFAALSDETDLLEFTQLAALTGMRLAELAGLNADHFERNKEGVLFLRVADSKTKAGYRTVPIVRQLEAMIQRRIETAQRGHGDGAPLWPDAGVNKYGERGTTYSKRFGRLKAELGFTRSHDFHSFRRFVYTRLEFHGVSRMAISRVLGHEVGGMADVYSEGTTDLGMLRNALEEVAAEVMSDEHDAATSTAQKRETLTTE